MSRRPPLSGKVGFRPYSAEEATAKLARIGREASRLKRMYAGIYDEGTTSVRFVEDRTSGSGGTGADGVRHPTEDAAIDLDKAALRRMLPALSGRLHLADRALQEMLEMIRNADRMPGEQVGESGVWDTERAERAEARAGARHKSGAWRMRA